MVIVFLDLSTNYSKRYLDEQHILMIKRIDDLNQVYWYAQDGKPLRKYLILVK
ncbi:MAG: hypothetical protein ACLRQF_24440 [Thomasclavelia ramosa]